MSILGVRGLTKSYPGFTLGPLDFELEAGKITGFIGRNGAGKTTTLKSMLGFVHPDGGQVDFFGLGFRENEAAIKARFLLVVAVELAQAAIAVPFALLRARLPVPGNAVGLDANLAFFGFAFLSLGIFNAAFFGVYYRDVRKVGKAFVTASSWVFAYMIVVEASCHLVPLFRDRLDTPDPAELGLKLAVLALGLLSYAGLTAAAYLKARRDFERQDL